MNTATCPHCETILEAEPGVATVCGVCGQEFTPSNPQPEPTSEAPRSAPATPSPALPARARGGMGWLWWLLLVVLVAPLAIVVIGVVSVATSSETTKATELISVLFGGALGAAVVVGLFLWAVLWITFPVFVYLYLRRILRAIEANTAAKHPTSRQ